MAEGNESPANPLSARIQAALEQTFDQPVSLLRQELAGRLQQECAALEEAAGARAAEAAARAARSALAEALQAAARRIRQASTTAEIEQALLASAPAFCGRAALLLHQDGNLTGGQVSGISVNGFAEAVAGFEDPASESPALAQAIQTREALVAEANHLSPTLVQRFGVPPEEKTYLFPLSSPQGVVAVLYADSVNAPEGVQTSALELLCLMAEARLEALSTPPPPPPPPAPVAEPEKTAEPQKIESAEPVPQPPAQRAPTDWDALTGAEQEMHMRAQRFARVLVADLQLYRAKEIRQGKKTRNLYDALKEDIDKSREVYRRKFGNSTITGIDYFHLELVRTVASEEEALLGPAYPGPLTG